MHARLNLRRLFGDALRTNLSATEKRIGESQAKLVEQLVSLQTQLAMLNGQVQVLTAQVPEQRFGTGTYLGDNLVLAAHPAGLQMMLDSTCRTVAPYVVAGSYERDLITLWSRLVSPGDLVLEIGANQGYHTLALALAVGPTGRVVAYEPTPRTARVLELNVVMTGMTGRVSTTRAAVSDSDGQARFRALTELPAGNRLVTSDGDWTDELPGEFIDVDVHSAATVLGGLARVPNVIKIDAEGHEIPILRALLEVLPDDQLPVFVVEVIPGTMEPHGGLEAFLQLAVDSGLHILAFQNRAEPTEVDTAYLRDCGWEDVLLVPDGFELRA